ncbi:hypothetical protein [Paenibacillus nasutitermitis]|uniref:Uncharacterized protein n=1 Tax=Paenibacillus nasutitermitis TaxID=1652958 RepID=A0A916YX00_9BACL|nr:hypothetical protein [Paenibacillus nasutitermitis]GGD65249.1 hypothetical protein GCM10010911_23770 [Paenibacillus nasutitermitis]
MRLNVVLTVMIISLLGIAGCASGSMNRTPDELLGLTVSGLSGVDHYTFKGTTKIAIGDGTVIKPISFQGEVRNHEQLEVKSSDSDSAADLIHPLELLKEIEQSAASTELIAAESDKATAVLQIKTDEKAAARLWAGRLRSQFKQLQSSIPGTEVSPLQQQDESQASAQFKKEWDAELARSGRLLEEMLATLHVSSTYKLQLDRSKMLPLRLQEHTVLRYKTQGQQRQETRSSDVSFPSLAQRRK